MSLILWVREQCLAALQLCCRGRALHGRAQWVAAVGGAQDDVARASGMYDQVAPAISAVRGHPQGKLHDGGFGTQGVGVLAALQHKQGAAGATTPVGALGVYQRVVNAVIVEVVQGALVAGQLRAELFPQRVIEPCVVADAGAAGQQTGKNKRVGGALAGLLG
ncbi:hypothetical protein [Pseudomonas sp.]|uniref:hypothetical protein n=1 Tax=Pseudomonas sp. TaxID=306 RepID=UPI003242603D